MAWSQHRFTTSMVEMQFYDIHGRDAVLRHALVGHTFTTCPGRDAVLRHALVGTQFYDMPWSQRSFTTCPGCNTVLRHPWSRCSFTTWSSTLLRHGRDAVLRHALVGTQFYDMPWSRRSLTTCPGRDAECVDLVCLL